MKQKPISFLKKLAHGPLAPFVRVALEMVVHIQLWWLELMWKLGGIPAATEDQQARMRQKVTFVFKSFQRQGLAKRLYKNIQRYYPGVRVIIADDSKEPLTLTGPGLTVVQLPFNSGLSRGLNAALERVETPFVVRMDDDELLTPYAKFHEQLEFLLEHPEVDLAAVLPRNLPLERRWKKSLDYYVNEPMGHAPKPLKIPHGTWIDCSHVVLGKVPNIFLARTEKYRALGYDDNIRMLDHQNFFFRAAGNLVSAVDVDAYVLHHHNRFDRSYQRYREDVMEDRRYIHMRYSGFVRNAPWGRRTDNK